MCADAFGADDKAASAVITTRKTTAKALFAKWFTSLRSADVTTAHNVLSGRRGSNGTENHGQALPVEEGDRSHLTLAVSL